MKKEIEKKEGLKKINTAFELKGSYEGPVNVSFCRESRTIPIKRVKDSTGKLRSNLDLK